MTQFELPLLSRPQVLFPGSLLHVQLREPGQFLQLLTATRSIQTKNDQGSFGFSLLLTADKTDKLSKRRQMRIGTEALIEDYHQEDSGTLVLKLRGKRRFKIQQVHCQHDGSMNAQINWLEEEKPQLMPLDFAPMVQVVARYLEKVQADYPQYQPGDCEDATFIGFRLADFLPMELQEKQMLLELDDPLLRLNMLANILPRFQRA